MRVDTRAYFEVYGSVVPPGALESGIGVRPSVSAVMAGKRRHPPVPAFHSWALDSGLGREAPLW